MITKHDLLEAIAECQGTRTPNANTAIKLAAFLTILDHMEDKENDTSQPSNKGETQKGYSFASGQSIIFTDGTSDFAKAIDGKRQEDILPILDELMSTVKMVVPRLYDGVMRKLQQ